MKRWSVLFLALALWALAGCGGPAADEGAAGEAPSVFAEASAPDAEGGLSAVRLEGQARPLTDEEIRFVIDGFTNGSIISSTSAARRPATRIFSISSGVLIEIAMEYVQQCRYFRQ